ncbi:MAG: CvpA family protein [Bacteroidales bacterium]|nr:CvpA family protein [Bacteroidales bacterium]
MTVLDIILALCFIPGIIHGISKGFLSQAAGIVSLVAGLWAAFTYKGLLFAQLKPVLNLSDTILLVISFTVILIAVVLLFSLIGKLLTHVIELVMLGWLNRIVGVIFSIIITAFILSILVMLFDWADTSFHILKPGATASSTLYHFLLDLGRTVFPYLKKPF